VQNSRNEEIIISNGDKIAQIFFAKTADYFKIEITEKLEESDRGEKGLGSTGA